MVPFFLKVGRLKRYSGITKSCKIYRPLTQRVSLFPPALLISMSTHLYSGMSGVTRRNAFRYAGVIESSLLLDELDVEVIADGIHLPAPLLKLIYKIKGPEKIALITDAMRAA